ncbi:hypothetical protein LSCM1_01437 [Leishmania martiniquensis]|uniref:Uncharacterized protein n=1 Tax=Leishmania martiniquensis TaxID=1580590 RepID=A0A836KMM6_9TRYP|nr:hypothetical protein LSCM1_01437 [Leishmania martiniquensis]
MYWPPAASSATLQGAPPIWSPYYVGMMPRPTVSSAAPETLPRTAEVSLSGAASMVQPSMVDAASLSSNVKTHLGAPPHTLRIAQGAEGGPTATSDVPPMMDPSQLYIRGLSSVAMPVNYATPTFASATGAPVMVTAGVPCAYAASGAPTNVAASSMPPGGGGAVHASASPMTLYQAGRIPGAPQPLSSAALREGALGSFPFFSPASPMVSQCFQGAIPWPNTAGRFPPTGMILVESPVPLSPANLPPPPQYSSMASPCAKGATVLRHDSAGTGAVASRISGSHLTPVVRNGDAGKGYEAGVYYEGRVKRFNPIRGYGFVSATHKLIPLQSYIERELAKAAESISASEKQGRFPKAKPLSSLGSGSDTEGKAGTNASSMAMSGVDAAAELQAQIGGDDVVYVKGSPHIRRAVTMGDIFVHHHCLQLSPCEVKAEANRGLVNLPAGSRVQFRAEVFVPMELMEKAADNKEAAAMLKNLGVSVEEKANLLSGAIATKKGWGYQAMEVRLLPPKRTLPKHLEPLKTATAVQDIVVKSFPGGVLSSSVLRGHAPSPPSAFSQEGASVNDEPSPTVLNRALSMPLLSQPLTIRTSAAVDMPSPPSFEEATSGMQQMMVLPNCAPCTPSYLASQRT